MFIRQYVIVGFMVGLLFSANAAMAKSHNANSIKKKPDKVLSQKVSSQNPVDINTASVEQLTAVKGIGKKKASDMIAFRDAHGPFKSVDELTKVKGIGKKWVKRYGSHLKVANP